MIDLIFDTETTGLIDNTLKPIDKQPHIIEFYGCLIERDSGDMVAELDLLIKPPIVISKEITKITGITNEMVCDSPVFRSVASQIETFVNRADRWVAHNLSYDLQMLKFEIQRCDKTILRVFKNVDLLCTVEQTEHIKGHRLKLTDLHEYLFGEPFKGAHRAKVDVEALTRCYRELIKRGEI